jgi:putative glutamine amidotransferase
VVTVQSPHRASDEAAARRKNALYLEAIERAGGTAVALDEMASSEERRRAFGEMDGLLLSGGADLDPALYGQERHPRTSVEAGRDALELEAWRAASDRSVPVLGVCRGFQAINVFSGGSLLQHLEGHTSTPYPAPEAHTHALRLEPDSRLAEILNSGPLLEVNTYHHQAVRPADLAPSLRAAGTSPSDLGELIEAVESMRDDQWVIGVQSHPERTEFTLPVFERLWRAFVAAASDARDRASASVR